MRACGWFWEARHACMHGLRVMGNELGVPVHKQKVLVKLGDTGN